jgi:hypothetical protein
MLHKHPFFSGRLGLLAVVCWGLATTLFPAAAATLPETSPSPSPNATINLINRMVQRGLLTKEDAEDLIKQADADAVLARAQSAAASESATAAQQAASEAKAAAAQAIAAQGSVVKAIAAQAPATQPAADQGAPGGDPLPPADDTVGVTYIPEVVKTQLRDELRAEVMTQARDENWAAPRSLPEWVSRFRLMGDFRFRTEGDFYPGGNAADGSFPNFNVINTGAGLDVNPLNLQKTSIPYYNVNQDRERLGLRARFGADIDLGDNFTAGFRIGTGDTNSPVSENQTLGGANSIQGGAFSKYAIWLDRGFLQYELGGSPEEDLSVTVGRFDNPFFATSMIWADDLGFDGAVIKGKYQVTEGVTPFLTVGAFPVFNTDLNFSTYQPSKFASEDKWLDAIQVGTDFKLHPDFSAKAAAAFYDFQNIEGQFSDPTYGIANEPGDTDDSRPSFAQRGNTYMGLRDIVALPLLSDHTADPTSQYQYFGLASPFRELAFTGRLDYNHFDPFHIWLVCEWVRNVAFNRDAVMAKAVNNGGSGGSYAGGDTGWIVNLKLGSAVLENRWDWNVGLGYRAVESDAVVDGFCDPDFGGGGTNLKGFTLSGNLALSPRVSAGLRWMSANSVGGPPNSSDIFQFDINAKF